MLLPLISAVHIALVGAVIYYLNGLEDAKQEPHFCRVFSAMLALLLWQVGSLVAQIRLGHSLYIWEGQLKPGAVVASMLIKVVMYGYLIWFLMNCRACKKKSETWYKAVRIYAWVVAGLCLTVVVGGLLLVAKERKEEKNKSDIL